MFLESERRYIDEVIQQIEGTITERQYRFQAYERSKHLWKDRKAFLTRYKEVLRKRHAEFYGQPLGESDREAILRYVDGLMKTQGKASPEGRTTVS